MDKHFIVGKVLSISSEKMTEFDGNKYYRRDLTFFYNTGENVFTPVYRAKGALDSGGIKYSDLDRVKGKVVQLVVDRDKNGVYVIQELKEFDVAKFKNVLETPK